MKTINQLFAIVLLFLVYGFSISKPITSEGDFNTCFPTRNKFYTYLSFTKAISEMAFIKIKIEKRGAWIYKISRTDKRGGYTKVIRQDKDWDESWAKAMPYTSVNIDYEDFCATKNASKNKKEIAAFFAHVAHETRNGLNNKFNDGLMRITEIDTNSNYVTQNLVYPAVKGKKYFGRGPLQLSYNGNYGFASDCIFGDKDILLNNPELVSNNATLAFETAIYFWMTPQSLKPSAHDVMAGNWIPTTAEKQKGYSNGFGMTINIINGKIECGKGENIPSMKDRISFYQFFLNKFKVNDTNCLCSCSQMVPLGE